VVHARGLRGGTVYVDAHLSNELLPAFLLVAPCARRDVFIEIRGRRPDQSCLDVVQMMADVGVTVVHENLRKFIVAAPQRYRGANYAIEPDPAEAACFLAAPAIAGGQLTVETLGTPSSQALIQFVNILEQIGCRIEHTETSSTVRGPGPNQSVESIDVDLGGLPDLVAVVAVLALFARGPTRIRNVADPRTEQTDRLAGLLDELAALGARAQSTDHDLVIHSPDRIKPRTVDTHGDPHLAMAFALIGLRSDGITIRNPQCTSQDFPDFFARFSRLTEPQP
jgi:3-phosphoshikimate 1-carboxyvinyltransferase